MHVTRAWALVSYAVIFSSAALICCGNDEALWLDDTPRGDLVGGERSPSDAGRGGGGGSGQSTSGSGGTLDLGGSSSTLGGGASDGGTLSSEAGAGGVVAGGGGAAPTEEQLGFCARLDAQTARVGEAGKAYVDTAYADCDTYWIIREVVDRGGNAYRDFRNALNPWSYNLWGCQDATPVEKFSLVWESPEISAGDAQRLIDIYVAAVDEQASLSPGEEAELRAALERLSQLVVADPSLAPSRPNSNPKCQGEGGTGGTAAEGGAGGSDPGPQPTAGQGGAP